MIRLVILDGDGIVDNVIIQDKTEPYEAPAGYSTIPVSADTFVGKGMRHVVGSNPPAFEQVPVEEQPTMPQTVTEALDAAQAAVSAMQAAIDAARANL